MGTDSRPGHHRPISNILKLPNLLTFSLTWGEAVDKIIDHLSRNNYYPKYTFIERGVHYLSKTVPNDPKHHYKDERITQSLKTKSQHQASRSAAILVSELEDYWINVRLSEAIVPIQVWPLDNSLIRVRIACRRSWL